MVHRTLLSASAPHASSAGFDPLRLGSKPEDLRWYVEAVRDPASDNLRFQVRPVPARSAPILISLFSPTNEQELQNGRWAMLACAGILGTRNFPHAHSSIHSFGVRNPQ